MTRLLAVLIAALVLVPATRAEEPKGAPASAPATGVATATIPVKGMHCGSCVGTVTAALQKVQGVKSVEVDLEKAQAVVVFDRSKASVKKLVKTIDATGYHAGEPSVN